MATTHPVHVDPTNDAQFEAWDGDEGAYWAAHPDEFERSTAAYRDAVLTAAAPMSDDRVLDIGCGTGAATRDAARRAREGAAVGVDLSSPMLHYARERAEADGIANVSFVHADAQIHAFPPASFDVAIGCAAAMFFGDKNAAFANVRAALRPGGRVVLQTWQPLAANEWLLAIRDAMAAGRTLPEPPAEGPSPFSLSDPDRVRSILTAAGYVDIEIDPVRASMWFGRSGDHAYELIVGLLGWMLDGLDDGARARAETSLRATTAAHQTDDGVRFGSAALLIHATKP